MYHRLRGLGILGQLKVFRSCIGELLAFKTLRESMQVHTYQYIIRLSIPNWRGKKRRNRLPSTLLRTSCVLYDLLHTVFPQGRWYLPYKPKRGQVIRERSYRVSFSYGYAPPKKNSLHSSLSYLSWYDRMVLSCVHSYYSNLFNFSHLARLNWTNFPSVHPHLTYHQSLTWKYPRDQYGASAQSQAPLRYFLAISGNERWGL